MSFDNWRKRLEVAKLPTVAARRAAISALKINFSRPTEDDEGYYRKPITEKDPKGNGKNIITDWVPVAYYLYDGALTGDIGKKPMTDNEVSDEHLWSWVVSHPIDYEVYQAVIEGAPWPDAKLVMAGPDGRTPIPAKAVLEDDGAIGLAPAEPAMTHTNVAASMAPATVIPAAGREVNPNHNQPPAEEVIPPEVQHAQAIDNAIGAAPETVTSEAEAAIAAGSMNRIAELRLAADKAGKEIYQPIFASYKAIFNAWNPMVGRAEAAEKRLKTAILTFRENERKRLAKIADEVAKRKQEAEEAAQRAADRAIVAGVPEPAPVVEPEPAQVIQQPAPIQPTYGRRAVKEELKKFAVIDRDKALDVDVYKFFRDNPKMIELIEKLATDAIRAGIEVPGTTTREGLV
jgi:hypothetical protein